MSAVPIIRPTSCPSAAELGDKSKRWSIVRCVDGRSYFGRLVGAHETGIVELADPFDYTSGRKVEAGEAGPIMRMVRQFFPCEHFDIDSILVNVASIIAVCKLSPKAVDSLREELAPAWDGRDHLRKVGGRLEIAGASTTIEAAR